MVFEKLEQRCILQGSITALTDIHIGAGKGSGHEIGDIDLPILKDSFGRAYIPGSSIKGKVRTEAERIEREIGGDVCTPPDVKRMCGTIKSKLDDLCICCRVFGTAGDNISSASKVRFRDSYPTEKVEQTDVRTGIAMNRSTASVRERALYSVESIPAGTQFEFELVTENLSEEESTLLRASIKSVEDSAIGGGSSRGFGKVKFQFSKLIKRSAAYYLGEPGAEQIIQGEDLDRWISLK